MSKCERCGQCCHYIMDGKLKKCKFLLEFGTTTHCRVYANRLSLIVDDGIGCTWRKNSKFDFPGCPYNTDKDQLIDEGRGKYKIKKVKNE